MLAIAFFRDITTQMLSLGIQIRKKKKNDKRKSGFEKNLR